LPPPVENMDSIFNEYEAEQVNQMLACTFVGSKETVREDMESFLEQTQVDEIIVAAHIFDQNAKLRSYELFAELMRGN
jgi:alkanesulfonate monooxygenase SsuD/methylene tetrahydromethanopterin reductase-like flavin-dependent oxidoreductase (luciferase family)